MTGAQKIFFLAIVPLAAAAIGGAATYYGASFQTEQIVLSGEAVQAAKDGKLTIEIVRRDEGGTDWTPFAIAFGLVGVFSAWVWLLRNS